MSEPELSIVDYDDIYEDLIQSEEELEDADACLEYLENSPLPYTKKWMEMSRTDPEVLEDIMKIIDSYLERPLEDPDDWD